MCWRGKKKETISPPSIHTGRVTAIGKEAATVEDTDTRHQYYAPFSTWGSVLRQGDLVIFQIDPARFSGTHRVGDATFKRFHVSHIARL